MMNRVHALLIGIDSYAPGTAVPTLRGCVNDARAVEAILRRQAGINLASYRVLVNEAATRSAVQGALGALTREVQAGDVVWIHYSGHGSKARINDPEAPSGFLETLVLWESRTVGGRDFYDREFGSALAAIEAAGAQVICFLDCCYAGGQTRDADSPAVRACSPDLRDAPTPADAAEVTNPLAPPPDLQRAVILAACRDEEKAAELLPEGQNALWHGAATWYLLRALDRATPGLTWAAVHEQISAAVRTRYARQTPQLLGNGNTLLFGGAGEAQPPSLTVLQVTGEGSAQRLQIDGGAALGINIGTRLAIYPANTPPAGPPTTDAPTTDAPTTDAPTTDAPTTDAPTTDALATDAPTYRRTDVPISTARIDAIEVGTAWATLESGGAITAIPVPALARVIAYGYGAARLKVAVESSDLAAQLESTSPLYELVGEETADLIVRGGGDEVRVEDGAGVALWDVLPVSAQSDAKALAQTLEHYAIFRNVQRLSNLALGPALEDALQLSAPVALKPSRGDRAAFGQATLLKRDGGGMWQAIEAQQVGVEVTNRHRARLLVTVLALNPDYSITQIEPRFERQTTLAAGKSLLVRFKIPDAEPGDRILLKVLATVDPVSFASLLLPPLRGGAIRRDAPVRDAGALGWLLDALRRTGATPTRPAFTDPDDQWIALDIPFQIVPSVSPSDTKTVE